MITAETSLQFHRSRTQTKPKPYVYTTQTEPEPNFLKVLRTRTETNPSHQRTWTKHKQKIFVSFPSLAITPLCHSLLLSSVMRHSVLCLTESTAHAVPEDVQGRLWSGTQERRGVADQDVWHRDPHSKRVRGG